MIIKMLTWMQCEANVKLQIEGVKKRKSIRWRRYNDWGRTSQSLQEQALFGKNCHIHNGAVISNSIIGDNCEILPGVAIRNSVIWRNSKIGTRSELTTRCRWKQLRYQWRRSNSRKCFHRWFVYIGKRSKLLSNIKIWPEKNIEDGSIVTRSLVWEDRWLRELFTDARISGIFQYRNQSGVWRQIRSSVRRFLLVQVRRLLPVAMPITFPVWINRNYVRNYVRWRPLHRFTHNLNSHSPARIAHRKRTRPVFTSANLHSIEAARTLFSLMHKAKIWPSSKTKINRNVFLRRRFQPSTPRSSRIYLIPWTYDRKLHPAIFRNAGHSGNTFSNLKWWSTTPMESPPQFFPNILGNLDVRS